MEPPAIKYARTSDGFSIAYCVAGEGPAFLLTPFPFNNIRRMWRQQTNLSLYEPLSRRFRLVHYDSRGQGMSSRDLRADHSYDDYMLDLEAVVDALRLDRFLLYGGPLSGHTAIRYAVRHPERVRALILGHLPIDNPLGGTANWEDLARTSWDTALTSFIGGSVRIGDAEGDAASRDYFQETLTQEGFLSMCRACRRSNVEAILPSVECPALVLGSANVPLAETSKRMAAAIPNARLLLHDIRWLGDLYTNDGSVPPIVSWIDQFLESLNESEMVPPVTEPPPRVLPESGTVTILFLDIADSTALTERLGDSAFRQRSRDLDAALRVVVRDCGGTAVEGKVLGDGVMAVFTAARGAIDCALRCHVTAETAGLPIHAGLHAGDVIHEADNVYGGAVNIASRVCGLSQPGEVLVSETVRALARTSASVRFEDRGLHELKGIEEPQRLYAVQAAL